MIFRVIIFRPVIFMPYLVILLWWRLKIMFFCDVLRKKVSVCTVRGVLRIYNRCFGVV